MSKKQNKNGYAWYVTISDYEGNRYYGIQYAWNGTSAISFFAKSKGVNYKGGSASEPCSMNKDVVERLGLQEYC